MKTHPTSTLSAYLFICLSAYLLSIGQARAHHDPFNDPCNPPIDPWAVGAVSDSSFSDYCSPFFDPYQPFFYLGELFGLRPEESRYLLNNPGISIHIRYANEKASIATNEIFGPFAHHNNDGDAFRHCYGAALLTRDLGGKANEFLELHENFPGNPPLEKIMDTHNNDEGHKIAMQFPSYGMRWSDEQLKSLCVAALHNGKLIRNLQEAREKQMEEEAARPKFWTLWSWWASWSWARR